MTLSQLAMTEATKIAQTLKRGVAGLPEAAFRMEADTLKAPSQREILQQANEMNRFMEKLLAGSVGELPGLYEAIVKAGAGDEQTLRRALEGLYLTVPRQAVADLDGEALRYLDQVGMRSAFMSDRLITSPGPTLDRLRGILQRLRPEDALVLAVLSESAPQQMSSLGNLIVAGGPLVDSLAEAHALAGVVAHELAHREAQDSLVLTLQKRLDPGLDKLLKDQLIKGELASEAFDLIKALRTEIQLAERRQMEFRADARAVRMAKDAGFEPEGLLRALEILEPHSVPAPTHPSLAERREALAPILASL